MGIGLVLWVLRDLCVTEMGLQDLFRQLAHIGLKMFLCTYSVVFAISVQLL